MPPKNNRIACWMSEKKSQKINWIEFERVCRKHGFELYHVNKSDSLDAQGPICVFFHKLSDVIARAVEGNIKCTNLVEEIENYLEKHPDVVVVDPIPKIRQLLNRFQCYTMLRLSSLESNEIFTPNCCELTLSDSNEIKKCLQRSKIRFPFVCKPPLGHGSKQAHEMSIVFNEHSLSDVNLPCVVQNFVNHNAVLYKIFVIGEKYHFVKRPSVKNFHEERLKKLDTISFETSDVSKADSQSELTVLDPEDRANVHVEAKEEVLMRIGSTARCIFGIDLIGIDVVIENGTGKYAIIDVNCFPGYDGFPDFYETVVEFISKKVNNS